VGVHKFHAPKAPVPPSK
jgi:pimeloyl-ACP methyl ester carboxylesterase